MRQCSLVIQSAYNSSWRSKWLIEQVFFEKPLLEIAYSVSPPNRGSCHCPRVVMVKGKVALDMRGRCSAGQKVGSCPPDRPQPNQSHTHFNSNILVKSKNTIHPTRIPYAQFSAIIKHWHKYHMFMHPTFISVLLYFEPQLHDQPALSFALTSSALYPCLSTRIYKYHGFLSDTRCFFFNHPFCPPT